MEGKKIDMCKGLREWLEDLVKAAKDKEYQEKLFQELGL